MKLVLEIAAGIILAVTFLGTTYMLFRTPEMRHEAAYVIPRIPLGIIVGLLCTIVPMLLWAGVMLLVTWL